MQTSMEKIKVDGSDMDAYVAVPSGPGPFAALVVMQTQHGLEEFLKEATRRLCEAGYVAVAIDLYHRDGPDCEESIDIRKTRLRDANVIKDVNATVEFLQRHPAVDSDRIGIIGFCMGGRNAFLMAAANPVFKAAVSYYGGGTMRAWGDGPSPFERIPEIHCPILAHFGEEDKNPSPEDMRKIDAELTKHGKIHEFYSYAGAGHGFMNKRQPGYRAHADQASWPRTLEFLARYLAKPKARAVAAS
ncbi:MAG TPA: dienelactone hydrolase family protein [Candidatus Acidoferrales bacterium]|nr:dienelactone hydrolase family protein [Candidatus Acidoferrales bacterium]